MKRTSRRKLVKEITTMYDLVWRLMDSERFHAAQSLEDYGLSIHDHKAEAFELLRDYMIEHFRSLI